MRHFTVALAGNPNVGKSTVFNALTGLRQHTGNWAGKTVEVAQGQCRFGGAVYHIVDLPGTYSLLPRSAEEAVARDFLRDGHADAAVVVCDATCLERSLILALQTRAVIANTVVCVNLMDEAARKGIRVDLAALGEALALPVVGASAGREQGLEALMAAVAHACAHPAPQADGESTLDDPAAVIARVRRAEAIAARAVTVSPDAHRADRRLDRLFTGRATGIPVMLALLCAVLWLTMAGANAPSRWLADLFALAEGWLAALLVGFRAPAWLTDALVGGVWRVLSWVVSVMLPPMAIFFPLFTLMEDFGYLPRVAFVLDHAFARAKACGKQALCMCMGLGCNAAGVVGCRIIDSPRERLIAILTNSLLPCNGRFPFLTTLIAIFFAGGAWGSLRAAALLTGVIVLGVAATFAVSRLLSATVLRGVPSSFALELPPYRAPRVGQVVVRSLLDRTLFVLGRAVVIAAPAGLLIWLCANVTVGGATLLAHCTGLLDPLGRLLGMDGVILMAFLLGFPANEIVLPLLLMGYLAGGTLVAEPGLAALRGILVANGWTPVTAACVMLFSLFHWPCSTTCLTIHKETGSVKWTLLAMAVPTALGATLCALVAAVARLLG